MTFESILIFVQFLLVISLYIISKRNYVMNSIPLWLKNLSIILSLVPIWGVVLFIGGCACLHNDIRKAKKTNKSIFRNSWINRILFGEKLCIK